MVGSGVLVGTVTGSDVGGVDVSAGTGAGVGSSVGAGGVSTVTVGSCDGVGADVPPLSLHPATIRLIVMRTHRRYFIGHSPNWSHYTLFG